MAVVHIVGAGVAGLACAVRLARAGRRVALYEAAGHAGGRCRSFDDATLGRSVDNGNHLMLGGNDETMAYLTEIRARDSLISAPDLVFPFVDLRSGARWMLRPNAGRMPWWLFMPSRRVPGCRPWRFLAAALRLAQSGPEDTVAGVLDRDDPVFERFWEPLAVAVLNTAAGEAAARPLWRVVALTFGRGGRNCRGLVARDGLSASLVDPAIAWLRAHGCEPGFGRRLRGVELNEGWLRRLDFGDRMVEVATDDRVVLALPPARIGEMLPGVAVPRESRAIANAHFLLPGPTTLPGGSPFLGVIGGTAQWIFLRGDVASVTVSAADAIMDTPAEDLAALLWADVSRALDLASTPQPPFRIVKERRATFAQTPADVARRPPARTAWANLFLAGDWTDTGLPATIESAVTSGHTAARLIVDG